MSTLLQLRQQVGVVLQEATPNFFTVPEMNAGIQRAFQYYALKMIAVGMDYFEDEFMLALVANQLAYDLPSLIIAPKKPYFSLAHVSRKVTQGFIPLNPSERRTVPTYTISTGVGDNYRPTYRMRGTSILFEPPPQFPQTDAIRIEYYYVPTIPTVDGNSMDPNFSVLYEPMVIDRAAIFCLENKDGSGGVADIQTIRVRLADYDKAFEDTLPRDDTPESIQYSGNNYKNTFGYY